MPRQQHIGHRKAGRRPGGKPHGPAGRDRREPTYLVVRTISGGKRMVPLAYPQARLFRQLPANSERWAAINESVNLAEPIAFAAAQIGMLPEGFDRWDLSSNGDTVAHAAASSGMLPPWFSQWGLRNDSGLTVAHTAAFFGQLPEDIPRDVLGLAAIGMSVAEAAAITGTLPPWFNDWDMPVPETDLRVLAHSVVRGGFIPEGFDRWHVAGKGGWTVAHEAAFCETLPDGLPQEILDAADRNGIAVRDIVAARRNGTATIADGRRIRIGTMHVGGTKSEDIPLETLEISPGNGGIQPLPANGSIDPLPLEDGWTVLLACSLLDRTRTLKPDDPRLLECKNAYGFSLAHLSADRRTLPPGFDRWDARGSEGVTVAHHAARSRGGLPADFDAWDLRDGHGIPVAEVAVVADTLPPGFSRWDITCMRGVPVAHVAASLGRLPAGFDQWALMWPRGGQTVAHAAALAGTLPPGFDRWELEDSWGTPVVHYGAIVGGLPEDTPDRALAMTDKDGTTAAEMLLTTHVEHADHKAGLRLKELRDRAKRVVQRLRRERLRHSGE